MTTVEQIGRYQIVEEVGRGAMGIVYKALDPKIGRTIAIKTIRFAELTDTSERQRVRERLLREAQSAGVLSHPNIVTIYDIHEEHDLAYIFMEFVEGATLENLLRTGKTPDKAALLQYLRQVAGALDYAHHKGIIHRDIKPANVMICEPSAGSELMAKVTDFGVAKFISQEMTMAGTMVGTPTYMSPEQIQSTAIDGRSDQFSLAAMVYETLAGVKPFAGENLAALFYLICKEDPKPIQEFNATLTPEVDKVIRQALSKSPDSRFVSCSDFVSALSVVLAQSPQWLPRIAGREPVALLPARASTSGNGQLAPAEAAVTAVAPGMLDATFAGRPAAEESPKPYELPPLRRRPRLDDDEPLPKTPKPPPPASTGGGRRWGLLVALLLAAIGAAVFFTRWKPAPDLPTQVLDTKSGETAPPPTPDASAHSRKPDRSKRSTDTTATEAAVAKKKPPAAPQLSAENRRPARVAGDSRDGGTADVDLLTDPPNAKITVDGNSANSCTTPCTLSLPNGRHTLTAERKDFELAHRVFSVPQDNSVFVSLPKSMGVLVVTSEPSGSKIFVDGHEAGITPKTLHLTAGQHQIAVVNGAQRQSETVDIQHDGFSARSYRWQDR